VCLRSSVPKVRRWWLVTTDLSQGTVRVGVVSDIHVTPDLAKTGRWNELLHYDRSLPRLAKVLDWFAGEALDAVFVLGDLTEDGDLESLRDALDALASGLDVPGYVLAGNHDAAIEHLGQEVDARPPLALVNDGLVRTVPFGTAHQQWHGGYRFTVDVVAPDTDDLLILASHYPLITRQRALEARGLRYAGDIEDIEAQTAALSARRAPTVVLTGHAHVGDAHAEGRVLQLVNPPVVEGDGWASIVAIDPVGVVEREIRAIDANTVRRTTHRYAEGRWTES
jgi:predicted phosphodiesterase